MNAFTSMFANGNVHFAQPVASTRDLSGRSGVYQVTFRHVYQNEFNSSNGPGTSFNILGDAEMVGNSDIAGRVRFTLFVPNESAMKDWERANITDFLYLSGALKQNAAGGYDVDLQTKEVESNAGRRSTEVINLAGVRMVVALKAVPGKNGYGPSLQPKAFFNQDCFCAYELANGIRSAEAYKKFIYLNELKEIETPDAAQGGVGRRSAAMSYSMAPSAPQPAAAVNPYAITGGAPAPQAPGFQPYQQAQQAAPYGYQGVPAAAPAPAAAQVNPYAMQGQPQPQQVPAGSERDEVPF